MSLSDRPPDCVGLASSVLPPNPETSGWSILRGASGDIGLGQETEERWYWDAQIFAWRVHPNDIAAYAPHHLACLAYIYVRPAEKDQ
jgi:hypothetical protein